MSAPGKDLAAFVAFDAETEKFFEDERILDRWYEIVDEHREEPERSDDE